MVKFVNKSKNKVLNEKVVYSGKIFEIVEQKRKIDGKDVVFEIARRSPGVRLIIIKNKEVVKEKKCIKEKMILITKEYRSELNDYDYRLPGGKVFDTLNEYNETINNNSIDIKNNFLKYATIAAKKECREETGILPKKIKLYQIAKAGATIEWNLFYFIVEDFEEQEQDLGVGEDISVSWKSFSEVKELCLKNKISEDRTVGVLLRFLNNI
jgi:ADP-ribose pyrophosphatase